jgi:hypothetical protein
MFELVSSRAGAATMSGHRLDEAFVLWSAARAEANLAYDAWCGFPGADAYAVYRAAEDRADAAEADLEKLTLDTFIFA